MQSLWEIRSKLGKLSLDRALIIALESMGTIKDVTTDPGIIETNSRETVPGVSLAALPIDLNHGKYAEYFYSVLTSGLIAFTNGNADMSSINDILRRNGITVDAIHYQDKSSGR
jgi:hypothetical protein